MPILVLQLAAYIPMLLIITLNGTSPHSLLKDPCESRIKGNHWFCQRSLCMLKQISRELTELIAGKYYGKIGTWKKLYELQVPLISGSKSNFLKNNVQIVTRGKMFFIIYSFAFRVLEILNYLKKNDILNCFQNCTTIFW